MGGRNARMATSSGAVSLLLAAQPVRFVIVGGVCFVSVLSLFALMRLAFTLPLAATIAYAIGAAASFELNRRWTFGAAARDWDQAGRFVVITVAAIALNTWLLQALVTELTAPEIAAEILALLCIAPLTFLAYRHWGFRSDGPGLTLSPSVATSGAGATDGE